jgi:hypothetical protein
MSTANEPVTQSMPRFIPSTETILERNTRQTRNAVRYIAWFLSIIYAFGLIGGIVIYTEIASAISNSNSSSTSQLSGL